MLRLYRALNGANEGSIDPTTESKHRRAAVLDHCIVRIRHSSGGRVLYQHPNYHHGKIELRQKDQAIVLEDGRSLLADVLSDGQTQAAFESVAKAMRYVQKLGLALA